MDNETDTQNVVIHAKEMLIDTIFLQDCFNNIYNIADCSSSCSIFIIVSDTHLWLLTFRNKI